MVFRASTCSFTSLQSYVEPELLRGVPLHECLSGWAKHWKQSEQAMCSTDSAAYDLGQQIEEYDVFLSHDWATSRWLKLFSMMIIFNSRAAFFTSFLASLTIGFLRAFEVIPDQLWTICFGYVVYFVILCFWQRLRRILPCFRPLMVFVDKLCIPQHDEAMKEKGILALAGFLDHSRKLTVLWSTRYFQRLWCAYELAAYSRAEEKPLQVMPVKMSVILGLMSLYWHVLCITFHIIAWSDTGSDPVFSRRLMASFFSMLLLCTMTPGVCYFGIQLMDDLTQLPQQLKSFRIQEAKCFCCTSNHIHPVTGRRMICDRSLVFHTLKKWFGSRADKDLEGSHLDLFNQMIQEELSQSILQTVGSDTAPLSYCIYMVSAGNVPFIAQYIARIAAGLRGETSVLNHAVASSRQLMSWGSLSLLSICAVRVSMAFWKLGLKISSRSPNYSRGMVSVFISPLIVLTLSVLWLPFQVAYALTSGYSSVPAIPFGIVILVTFYLFTPTVSTVQRKLRQKLSDRYQSRRSRKTHSGFSRSSMSRSSRSSRSDIFSDPSRGSKESQEFPTLSPRDRGSKELFFMHAASEKSRVSKNSEKSRGSKDVQMSRQTSMGSIETIAATGADSTGGVVPIGSESMGLESIPLKAKASPHLRLVSVGLDSHELGLTPAEAPAPGSPEPSAR